jgi:hypothetical protein
VLLVVGSKNVDEPAGESTRMKSYVATALNAGYRTSKLLQMSNVDLVHGSAMNWGVVETLAQTYRLP